MRKACVPQSNGTPRIAALAPVADAAHGTPMNPRPVWNSSVSARSPVFVAMTGLPLRVDVDDDAAADLALEDAAGELWQRAERHGFRHRVELVHRQVAHQPGPG